MAMQVSYLVDLAKYTFEEGKPTWVQALPVGTWHHPVHGEIAITPERVKQFADNVNGGVRGQDLNIDYDHQTGEAAGWVKAAENRGTDGLWLSVDWTPTARQQLAEKKYRYFSPEFQDEWEHPVSKAKLTDVLFGGALTNRPFLKGIMPINLSEAFAEASAGGTKLMAQPQGAPQGGAQPPVGSAPAHGTPVHITGVGPIGMPQANGYTDPATGKALTETDLLQFPAIKALLDSNKLLTERIVGLEATTREAQVAQRLSELSTPNAKGQILAPSVIEEARKALSDPAKAADAMVALLEQFRGGNAFVQLGEVGTARTKMTEQSAKETAKSFTDAVAARAKADSISYSQAASLVAMEQPQLAETYSNAVMAIEA